MWIKNIETGEILQHKDMFPNTSFANSDIDCTPEWLASMGCEEFVQTSYTYVPTQEDIIKQLTQELEYYYDRVAQVKKYDNRLTCALRAGYAGTFQSEGIAFAIWMDNCNSTAYSIMEQVLIGNISIPTSTELIDLLPSPPWELPPSIYASM